MNERTSKGDSELNPQRTLLGAPKNQVLQLQIGVCWEEPAAPLPVAPTPPCSTTLPHLVSSILSSLKLPHQPLELSSRICGVDQEPEVLTGTKIHIERDETEAGAWGKGIEPPNSETKRT